MTNTANMSSTNKFCKDCKYSKAAPYAGERYLCTHEISTTEITVGDLVVGTQTRLAYSYCSRMRVTNCGEEGHFFEERQDLVYKIIKFFKKV